MNNFFLRVRTSFIITIIFLLLWFLPPVCSAIFFVSLLFFVLSVEWSVICQKRSFFYYLTPLYPVFPFCLLMWFSLIDQGKIIIAFLFLFTSFFDTSCYIVGNLFGKTLLFPSVSPKKTVEGFIGGAIIVLTITIFTMRLFDIEIVPWRILFITGMIIAATAGDLFESWIKRHADIKDVGDLLPGHGGILDRVDSLLFVVMYFYFL